MSCTDTIIVAVAILIVASLYAIQWQPDTAAHTVTVWVTGKERLHLPLDRNRVIDIQGAIGTTTLEIKDSRARIVSSPGIRKLCVRMGWLQQSGESAVCLPNQVVIQLEGTGARFDGINF